MVRTKKLIALILALVLVLGLAATALANENDADDAEENGAEVETVATETEATEDEEEAEEEAEEPEAETVYLPIAAISAEYTAVPLILADIISEMHLIEGPIVTVPEPLTTDFAGGVLSDPEAFVVTRASVAQANEYGAIVAVANWRNPASVELSTMRAMASVAGDMPLLINADTVPVMVLDVDVRVAFAPANATKDIELGGTTRTVFARALAQAFVNVHGGTASAISLAHQGEFGMEVRVAARVDESITAANASFYTFDAETNRFTQFTPSFVWLDRVGYLHFTTTVGGDIVVSNRSVAPAAAAPAPAAEEAPAPAVAPAPAPAADDVEDDEEDEDEADEADEDDEEETEEECEEDEENCECEE